MTNTVSIDVRFSAAHRLMDYDGKCACLHGHSYKATVTVGSEITSNQGFVIDFGELRKPIKAWIDQHFDHNTLLRVDDPLVHFLDREVIAGLNGRKGPRLFSDNPTAENIARDIANFVKGVLKGINGDKLPGNPRYIELISVSVNEEEGTMACVRGER